MQAEAIDTPFSSSEGMTGKAGITPKAFLLGDSESRRSASGSKRTSYPGALSKTVASTGSGGFDAYIDQEAQNSNKADNVLEGKSLAMLCSESQ